MLITSALLPHSRALPSFYLSISLFFLWPCSSSSKCFLTQWCSASQFYFLLITCFDQGSLSSLSIWKVLLFLGHNICKSRTWRLTQSFYLSKISFKVHNSLVWAQLLVSWKKTLIWSSGCPKHNSSQIFNHSSISLCPSAVRRAKAINTTQEETLLLKDLQWQLSTN